MTATSPRFVTGLLTAVLLHALVLFGWRTQSQIPLSMPSKLVLRFSPMPAGRAAAIPDTPRQPEPTAGVRREAVVIPVTPTKQRATPAPTTSHSLRPVEPSREVTAPERHSLPDSGGAEAAAAAVRVRYEQALAAWLDQHKYYPASLRRRGLEGEGVLRVRLARDGHVLTLETFSALPDPLLERVAMDWVRRADPFPPVPDEVDGADYSVRFPVRFRLD